MLPVLAEVRNFEDMLDTPLGQSKETKLALYVDIDHVIAVWFVRCGKFEHWYRA